MWSRGVNGIRFDVDGLRIFLIIDALYWLGRGRRVNVLSFHGRAIVVADAAGDACEAL